MNPLRFGLAALLLTASVALAAGPPPARPPRPADRESLNDQMDYLFLASDRPVLIRLHLRLGDKPYAQAWGAWMDKMFDWFDRDASGSLSAAEVARLPGAQPLTFHLQGSIGGFFGNQTMPMVSVDANKDGQVSRDELRAFYRKNGLGALRLSQSNFQANEADKINKAIYARINKKKDGKLTQSDAARFPDLLTRLDENEDELLALAEVNTRVDMGYYAAPVFDPEARRGASSDFGLIDIKGGATTGLVRSLLKAYDGDRDGRLSAAEIGLDKGDFAALDRDGDGKLSAAELAAFFKRPPDLTLRGRVGALSASNSVLSGLSRLLGAKGPADRTEVLTGAKFSSPLAKKVKRVNPDSLALTLGDTALSIQAFQGPVGQGGGAKQFYLRQFDNAANKQDSLDRKQAMSDPYLGQMFSQADRDADGKLTRKELAAWLDLLGEGSGTFVNLTLNDLGRSLFQVVDANRDNQLSIRELRTAWDRIRPLCRDKEKSFLRTADLSRSLTVTVQQGFNGAAAAPVAFVGGGAMSRPAGRPANAPLWFRKMDRNNDGDISPREWLGTDEDFREIDADGDGLLSPEEARAFEAKTRKEEREATKK